MSASTAQRDTAVAGGGNAAAVLVVDDVRKAFRHGFVRRHSTDVLLGASLDVRRGELIGLVGENGSGKSTLMQIVAGMLVSDAGTVVRTGSLGYCPQIPLLYEKLTCREHVELFAVAYRLETAVAERSAATIFEELSLEHYADYRVDELSGGTRQKLNLALALLHEPDLLLLDEPYAGFDWETYLRFWDMAARRRALGMGILVISHLLAERDRLDRLYVLRDGRCAAEDF